MYEVVERRTLVPDTHLLTIHAPLVASKVQAGQFIILRADEASERIPLSVADWDREQGTVTSVFLEAGASTMKLARMNPGDAIPTYMGPLGKVHPIEPVEGTVILCGGCYGIAALYPIARAHREAGNRILTVLEAHSDWLLYWQDRHAELADELVLVSSDGSSGAKGLSFDVLKQRLEAGEPIAQVHAVGCTFMMEHASDLSLRGHLPIRVALNPIMIDGTGMCGGCRCNVDGERRFACVDGPEFDGRLVDWLGLAERRRSYRDQEIAALRRFESRGFLGSSAPAE